MTAEEEKEYQALKQARDEQGFFTPEQEKRWYELHKLQAEKFNKSFQTFQAMKNFRHN